MKAIVIHPTFASQIFSREKVWEVRSWRIPLGEYLVVSNQRAAGIIKISHRLRVDPDGAIWLEDGDENLLPEDFEEQVWAGEVPLYFHLISDAKPAPRTLQGVRIRGRQKIFNITLPAVRPGKGD